MDKICEDISKEKITEWSSDLLDSTQRYQLYKLVETYNDLETKSISVEGICGKKKILIKKKNKVQPMISNQLNQLTSEHIDLFIKYSKLPIPINSPEHLEYYVNLIKPYYDTNIYNDFIHDFKTIGFKQIKLDISKVKNQLINLLKSNNEYKIFQSNPKIKPAYPNDFMKSGSVYNQNNLNKHLLSIDIRSANWNCYKKITSQSMDLNWSKFVSTLTSSKFISNSKHFREVIFGEINSKKLNKFIGEFLFDLDKVINSNTETQTRLKKILCLTDEIIYEITDVNEFNFNNFVNTVKKSLTTTNFNQIYRVEQFELKKIYPYDYYLKKISHSNLEAIDNNPKIQFKQIPRHFVPQVIKYYQNEEVGELDKKFMFENISSTFDKKLCFEKII